MAEKDGVGLVSPEKSLGQISIDYLEKENKVIIYFGKEFYVKMSPAEAMLVAAALTKQSEIGLRKEKAPTKKADA